MKMELNIQLFAASTSISCTQVGENIQNNTTTERITVTITRISGITNWYNPNYRTLTINCDGQIFTVATELRPNETTKQYSHDFIIQHNQDGAKTISFSSSIAATASLPELNSSGTKVLKQLHKPPIVSITNIVELNSSLISAGVTNDTFVQILSKKGFTINSETFDGASTTGYSVQNGSNIVSGQSAYQELQMTQLYLEGNLVSIVANASDSLNSIGSTKYGYSNYVLYQNPTIENTSTTTKRNGQTSGKVLLNFVGNIFKGQIGNVNNTVTVLQYRFWKKGETPPEQWIQIPSESISIDSNGRVIVSNYEIGSDNPSASNYFDWQYAYNIEIVMLDNFYYAEVMKGITVGEAVWSEYQDRVDFKKITQGGVPIVEHGTNANGQWIKFADGIMICTKRFAGTTNITEAWGTGFTTSSNNSIDLGYHAQEFIELLSENVTIERGGYNLWLASNTNANNTHAGYASFLRFTAATNVDFVVNIFAIGRWK